MKPTTAFTTVWTKETLERIREEYLLSSQRFLCWASPAFRTIWHMHKHEIQTLARAFDPTDGLIGDFNVLFNTLWENDRPIRLAFLEYEINRLTP